MAGLSPPGSSWGLLLPPLAISTNKHFLPALYKVHQENMQLSLKTGTDFY